ENGGIWAGSCGLLAHIVNPEQAIARDASYGPGLETQSGGCRLQAGGVVVNQVGQTACLFSKTLCRKLAANLLFHLGAGLFEGFALLGLHLVGNEDMEAARAF